jgi:pyruvate/2-oxoacid:ferredoxin oxidoreductase alpha subunit
MYCRHRQALGEAMAEVPDVALAADREWSERTGRGYGLVERYRCDGARTVIVTMGSMCGTARDAVDAMREEGLPVGLVKVRLFRPLPAAALRAALAGVPEVLVLDRNYSPGHGGVLHQELRAALYGAPDAPRMHGFLAGVGGVNVSPQKIAEFVRMASTSDARPDSVWAR